MSQFNLDLSYNFKGVKARSQSVRDAIEHAGNQNMTFADDLAGDVFNALYQHNPTLGAADNSQYSQVIRAAINSPQFQHLRMQTRDSLHWSSVAAALITSNIAEKLNWQKEEKPPEPPKPPKPDEESEQSEDEGDEESDNPGNEPGGSPSDEPGKQSSDEFDENEDDSDGDSDADSEDGNETADNEPGENEEGSDKDKSEPNEEDTNESGDNGEPDKEEKGEESGDGNDPSNEKNEGESSDGDDGSDSGESDNDEDSDNESEDSGDDGKESTNEEESESQEPIEEPGDDISKAINDAAKDVSQLMGGIRAGTQESLLGSKEEAQLAELYTALGTNDALSRMIQMIGRMQINQHFLQGVSYATTETPVSITAGDDINNVLPEELGLLLGNNEEFIVFADKFRNRELLQMELRAETSAGKGPMIVCLDESGSMDESKTHWAQSLTIAMYLQCVKERRQFALVKFASSAVLWPKPSNNVRMDIDFMKSIFVAGYMGGGTNFQRAWDIASQFIRSDPTWQMADIVFITDGMGNLDPIKMQADKDDLHVRLISFFIDPRDDLTRTRSYNELVEKFINLNDAFTHIQDLSERGEKQAFDLVRRKDAKGYFEVKAGKLSQTA